MTVVVTVASLGAQHGGPSRTVPALCCAMAAAGAVVHLVVFERVDTHTSAQVCAAGVNLTELPRPHFGIGLKGRARELADCVRSRNSTGETILYDVGLWLPSNHVVAAAAKSIGAPLVVSPRGMLSERALRVSAIKKKVAWFAYQQGNLRRAHAIHATSQPEVADCRRRGIQQPIACIPNGVDAGVPIRAFPPGNGRARRTALFLSRIHPIKGLRDLVAAWANLRPNGWRVVVAGPDEDGHRREIEHLAKANSVGSDFEFVGAVDGEQKAALFAQADLFVLPSHSESFGQSIAEALAAGVPVVTTRATPWKEIEQAGCGWWVDVGVAPLQAALEAATRTSPDELQQMGDRARRLAQGRYSWASVAEQMISFFDWLRNGGPQPEYVI